MMMLHQCSPFISQQNNYKPFKTQYDMRASVLAIKDLAYRAGRNISFDPEKFGEGLMKDLEYELNVSIHGKRKLSRD